MPKLTAGARSTRASATVILGAAALIGYSSYTMAAAAAAEEEEDQELAEVQVTGTRIKSPNATAPNPITTVDAEEMRRLGIVNVADAITQLIPQNISTYQPSLVGDDQASGGGGLETMDRGSFFIGNTIANLRGLDPTFGSRTLTLVDGVRVVSTSNQADVVDLNVIPSNLLQRVDVVTGGASATYGSGAMAGVVNLVLNRRLQGVNLDMDYGVSERNDGANPHVALSAGTSLLGGKMHMLVGAEWRKQDPILDCAAARAWCQESRTLFTNTAGATDLAAAAVPREGFEGLPARFQMDNARYSQFAPTGTIYRNDVTVTSNYRFDASGSDGERYALGYRGGSAGTPPSNGLISNIMNGDGPLMTTTSTLRPDTESRSLFSNFEYDFTSSTTASLQLTYAETDNMNRNRYTAGTYCARFDNTTTPAVGTNAPAGTTLVFGITAPSGIVARDETGTQYGPHTRAGQFGLTLNAGFSAFIGLSTPGATAGINTSYGAGNGVSNPGQLPISASTGPEALRRGVSFPFYIPVELSPGPPNFNFGGNAVGTWVRVTFDNWNPSNTTVYSPLWRGEFWILHSITLSSGFDQGTATVLPQVGRNSNAFLNNLSQEALFQVQSAFNNSLSAGGGARSGAVLGGLYGATPCIGSTAIRKVWNPQLHQHTRSQTERWSAQAGLRGRFGSDWQWNASYYYGANDSDSRQNNVETVLRLAFAMDSVIDDRVGSPTYGTPICRITRDGPPILDTEGKPLSNPQSLANLAEGCQPINIFGNAYSNAAFFRNAQGNQYAVNGVPVTYDAAALQQRAIDYAFVETVSAGRTTRQSVQFTTSGTLWEGWAGPLRGAFTLDVSEDTNNNVGTAGDAYLRSDLANSWQDAFSGKTRQLEPSAELSLPLLSGVEGADLLSVGATYRYGFYNVKGGAGTTGESATQRTPSWRVSVQYTPFDWVMFRSTRSQDMRAGTYRDLFIYQPSEPDQFEVTNPWRERTASSNENQRERWGRITVGNPNLKPERSTTLTLGMVLSPGGWAEGMRFSVDYSSIKVKDGINLPFSQQNPTNSCFVQSGGQLPQFGIDGELLNPGEQTAFDAGNPYCQQLRFAEQLDDQGNPIPGTRNLQDLVSYTSATPQNSLPYQNRGIDVSGSYNFPLNRISDGMPGSMALSLRATRLLEASGIQQTVIQGGTPLNSQACGAALEVADPNNYDDNGVLRVVNRYNCVNLVGQIRSNVFIPGVQAAPTWRGNASATYLYGNLTTTIAAQYTGGAKLDILWTDDPNDPRYYTADGRLTNATVDDNSVKQYFNFSLNGSYRLDVPNLKQFEIFGTVNNLFDKDPPWAGGGIGGAGGAFADTFGRSYRMGVRLKF